MGISLTGLTPATTYDALIKVGDNGPITSALKVLSDGLGTNLPMEASTTGVNFTGTTTVSGVAVANTTQLAAKQDTLVSGTNIKTINGTTVLGSGNIVTPQPSGVSGAIQFSDGSAFSSDATKFFWDNTNKRLGVGTNAPTTLLTVFNSSFPEFTINDGTIRGQMFANTGGGSLILGTATSHDLVFRTAFVSRLRILSTGNIGIGEDAPSAKLQIKGSGSTSATTSLLVQNSGGASSLAITDDRVVNFYNQLQGPLLRASTNLACSSFQTQNYGGLWMVVDDSTNVGNVNFGTVTAVASARVQIDSTTRGFLPPRMTTSQINAIASPANGLEVYNTTLACPCFYDGTSWRKVSHTTM